MYVRLNDILTIQFTLFSNILKIVKKYDFLINQNSSKIYTDMMPRR